MGVKTEASKAKLGSLEEEGFEDGYSFRQLHDSVSVERLRPLDLNLPGNPTYTMGVTELDLNANSYRGPASSPLKTLKFSMHWCLAAKWPQMSGRLDSTQ